MKLLILDSGHNEFVAGKCAIDKSMKEWEFNNDIQYKIKKRSEDHGITVCLTNPSPTNKDEIGLTKRTEIANRYWISNNKPKSIFISLHANAYGGDWNGARGCETYHSNNASASSKAFAKSLNDEVFNVCKKIDSNFINRGVKSNNFTVIYKTSMPGVLVEYGFYTNKADLNILKNNRNDIVEATVKAICKYFNIEYKQSTSKPTQSFLVAINTDSLNVRSGPSTSNPVVSTVKKGEVYTIIEVKNNWGKLKSGLGWVSLSYTINK